MARVNLRDLYPFYKGDSFIEIPDDVLAEIKACEREEETYRRYLRFHRVFATLDGDNPSKIEAEAVDKPDTPEEIVEREFMALLVHQAIAGLPGKQAKRIYAHFFLGMSKQEIAATEAVSIQIVRRTIAEGLSRIRKYILSKI